MSDGDLPDDCPDTGAPTGPAELLQRGGGNYELLGEIARGGMGIVLRARDNELGRDVAVKVLDDRMVEDTRVVQRFIEEAQIGGQLQHPGVVPVYELGRMEDERPYFAMKLIQGRTLADLLAARTGVDGDRRRFLSIFEAVCQTIAYAHTAGVLHRDLKPANIMVGAFGEVQVVDWGLAKVLRTTGGTDELQSPQGVPRAIHTVRSRPDSTGAESIAGSSLGTPAYMPPEQALGKLDQVDERSDVFALGGILCKILTGDATYVANEGEETVILAARAELSPAHARIKACAADQELKQLCLRCLSANPTDRPSDAVQVAAAIQQYLTSLEEKAHRAELAATEARELRRRQRLSLVLGATIVVALIVVGLVLRSMERQQQDILQAQLAAARQELDDASVDVAELQDVDRHEEALATARAALVVVEDEDLGDATLAERAQRLIDRAERRASEFADRQQRQRRHSDFLATCEDLRARQIDTLMTFGPIPWAKNLEAAYETAFRDYGIVLTIEEVDASLDGVVRGEIAADVALALDDLMGLRRLIHGPQAPEVMAVASVASRLDADPVRTRLREALLAPDEGELVALLQERDPTTLTPASLWKLSLGLSSFGRYDECFDLVRAGATKHPHDFLLNVRAGHLYGERGAHMAALGFLSSARAVRPTSAAVHALLAENLRMLGDLPRAAVVYAEAVRLDPDFTEALNSLAWLQLVLGDHAGSARSYATLFERFPEETIYDYKRLLAHFVGGEATASDVIERLESDASLSGRPEAAAVWTFCYHPDPTQRDPERVLRMMNSWGHEEPATEATKAAALLQLGEPVRALEALKHGEELMGAGAVSVVRATSSKLRADYAVLRARAYHDSGNKELALRYLEAAEEIMRELMYDGHEPWAGTPLVRLFRETEALLDR